VERPVGPSLPSSGVAGSRVQGRAALKVTPTGGISLMTAQAVASRRSQDHIYDFDRDSSSRAALTAASASARSWATLADRVAVQANEPTLDASFSGGIIAGLSRGAARA
jgi:hypothetical protein